MKLTQRQADILAALANGKTFAQISDDFSITRRTVYQHLGDARARLGAETLYSAIALFVASKQSSPDG